MHIVCSFSQGSWACFEKIKSCFLQLPELACESKWTSAHTILQTGTANTKADLAIYRKRNIKFRVQIVAKSVSLLGLGIRAVTVSDIHLVTIVSKIIHKYNITVSIESINERQCTTKYYKILLPTGVVQIDDALIDDHSNYCCCIDLHYSTLFKECIF